MKSSVVRVVVALFSAGWLLPFWWATDAYLKFISDDLPRLCQNQIPHDSFPFIPFASNALAVSLTWLSAVIFFWAYRLVAPKESNGRN
jgi:hypothetical protein